MFYYNIFSVSVFFISLFLIPRARSLFILYVHASVEVVTHQVLANYFIGTDADFHYFILLMGFLPFLIFNKKIKISVVTSLLMAVAFILCVNDNHPGVYEVSDFVIYLLRNINVGITILIIVMILFIFIKIVQNVEGHLKRQNTVLEKEINLASSIQQNFLKYDFSDLKDWDIAYYSNPMMGVSGDFYDFYKKDNILRGFGVFDVSGHGISSGLVTMLVKNIIFQEFYKGENKDLWEVMNDINDRVIEAKGDIENYLTGILVRIQANKIEMVNASHPEPIIYRKSDDLVSYIPQNKISKGAIGIQGFPAYYASQFFDLKSGDFIVLYTDGIKDLQNSDGLCFGSERLSRVIELSSQLSAESQIEQIKKALKNFCGEEPQRDDVTVVIIKKL